ncbi:MAG: hypothetical protein ACRD0N_13330 [Acidimicrobiales bacterium]
MTRPDQPGPAVVLRLAGAQALAQGHRMLDSAALELAAGAEGIGHDEVVAAVQALRDDGSVNVRFYGDSLIAILRLTEAGVDRWLAAEGWDMEQVEREVVAVLRAEAAAGRLGDELDLAAALGRPPLVVETVLERLRRRGEVVYNPVRRQRVRVHRIATVPSQVPERSDRPNPT